MDLGKNKKKIQAPQHFEFVALALREIICWIRWKLARLLGLMELLAAAELSQRREYDNIHFKSFLPGC
ncbi:hypothetical protein ACLOJK_006574 [Asimina triloba]